MTLVVYTRGRQTPFRLFLDSFQFGACLHCFWNGQVWWAASSQHHPVCSVDVLPWACREGLGHCPSLIVSSVRPPSLPTALLCLLFLDGCFPLHEVNCSATSQSKQGTHAFPVPHPSPPWMWRSSTCAHPLSSPEAPDPSIISSSSLIFKSPLDPSH